MQMSERDKPTYYKLIDAKGEVLAIVAKSKVIAASKRIETETGMRPTVELA